MTNKHTQTKKRTWFSKSLRLIREALAFGVRTTNRDVLGGGTTTCLAFDGESRHSATVSVGVLSVSTDRGFDSKYS